MNHNYTLTESLIVIGILFAVFFFFRYYPFKKKRVDKYPGATAKRMELDETEESIS